MELSIQNNEANIVKSCWEMLRPLSSKAKLKLASLLTTSLYEEESIRDETTKGSRIAIVRRRAANTPSDAELEARFAGKKMPEIPDEPILTEVIAANTGKTIKPIEKWL